MSRRLPPLLRVNEVTEFLEITRSQLQNMFPYLHTLRMPRQSRRFATPYIRDLATHLGQAEYRSLAFGAGKFSLTNKATKTMTTAESRLDAVIREHAQPLPGRDESEPHLLGRDITDILRIGRTSLYDWQQSGAFEIIEHRHKAYVSEAALRGALDWQRPEFNPRHLPAPADHPPGPQIHE